MAGPLDDLAKSLSLPQGYFNALYPASLFQTVPPKRGGSLESMLPGPLRDIQQMFLPPEMEGQGQPGMDQMMGQGMDPTQMPAMEGDMAPDDQMGASEGIDEGGMPGGAGPMGYDIGTGQMVPAGGGMPGQQGMPMQMPGMPGPDGLAAMLSTGAQVLPQSSPLQDALPPTLASQEMRRMMMQKAQEMAMAQQGQMMGAQQQMMAAQMPPMPPPGMRPRR